MSRARTIAILALGLSVLAVWALQHPYGDIEHDAMLYALLALARLHPDTVSNDVFLRFGSQDHFTVFSPVFSFMVRHFDLAPAAAIMTVVSQAALYGCAWCVARRFMSPASALLGTGLLLALPGFYGSGHLFSYTEDFLTARLPAEALALGSLAAALSGRMRIALASILAAMLIHPIIASAGVVMLSLIHLAAPRPRLATTLAGTLLLVVLPAAVMMHTGPFARFDTLWLNLVTEFTRYLFVSNWSLDDWVRVAIPIVVLLLGCLFAVQPVLRMVCACAIVCACSGVALTWIWCDLLQAILPTQMQLWRWVWMTAVLSVLLSPLIATECWESGSALQRAALVFIGSALLLRADSGAAFALLFAVMSAGLARWHTQFKYGRYILIGAFALLAFALGLGIADGLPTALLLACALFAVWALGERLQSTPWKTSALAAAAAVACLAVAPGAARSWTRFQFTSAMQTRFAPWRERLPVQAEVLWPESPVGVWYLLDRPSYWSAPQMAGFVFSRPAAVKLARRLAGVRDALRASGAHSGPAQDPDSVKPVRSSVPRTLESLQLVGLPIICADPDLGYLVTSRRLGPSAMPPVTPDPARPQSHYYIYDCKDYRGS
jgi:hypothetical protein